MGQSAYFVGQGAAPFYNSLAGALLMNPENWETNYSRPVGP